MALELANYDLKAHQAVRFFWGNRKLARERQLLGGKLDQGERSGVTVGKNMNGFISLFKDVTLANGLPNAKVHVDRAVVTLPGYFRPTKVWDILVVHGGQLVAAIELKSQVGPSFGNNFNNRSEEAIGTAHDFWVAYREGAFGDHPRPFVGWLMLVEDAPGSRSRVRASSSHFSVLDEFQHTSYLDRYDLLCKKLMSEHLYTSACVMASSRSAGETGDFCDMSPLSSLKSFVTVFAAHIAAESSRSYG